MDTEEVEDDQWDQYQRVGQLLIERRTVACYQAFHCHGREVCSDRVKTVAGEALDDVAVGSPPLPAWLSHVAVQSGMELEDDTL